MRPDVVFDKQGCEVFRNLHRLRHRKPPNAFGESVDYRYDGIITVVRRKEFCNEVDIDPFPVEGRNFEGGK